MRDKPVGPRGCRLTRCAVVRKYLCCADCERADCENRCLNGPERCGQVKELHGRGGKGPTFDRERILALYASGLSCADVAEQIGCHKDTVYKITLERRKANA